MKISQNEKQKLETLPGHRRKKTMPWRSADLDFAWRAKKPVLCLHAVTDKNGHPLENEDESGRRLCEHWGTIFQVRVEGQRHHHHENILRYVQKALDDFRWVINKKEFDELMATKKESAPGPDGIPYSLHRCAGRLGSQFFLQSLSTCARRWPCSCTVCCEQNRFHSQVLRRRQQWKNCEIAGRTASFDAVQLRLQDSYHGNL